MFSLWGIKHSVKGHYATMKIFWENKKGLANERRFHELGVVKFLLLCPLVVTHKSFSFARKNVCKYGQLPRSCP